jgi:hypothetical protein
MRSQLLRQTDSRAGDLQIDVDQRDLGPTLACELQCLGRRVCRPKHLVSRVLECGGGTVRNNRIILDD